MITYGPARDHVLGLEAILPDGSVLTAMNKLIKNNTGYDLKHLFIGSEGTLGIITRAVLRLRSRPTTMLTALCACPNPAKLVVALAALREQLGPSLSAFEAMWPDFWDIATSRMAHRSPFNRVHGSYALVEMSGFDAERDEDRLQSALSEMLSAGILEDAVIAQTGRQATEFWAIRESVGELRGCLGPITSFDVGIQAQQADAFVEATAAALRARWPDVIHLCYGHLGDNNIHIIVHIPACHASQPKNEIDDLVYAIVARFSGCVSAEHGIGLTKRPYLPLSRSPQEIAMMRAIKAAIDPKGIMNPGKILDDQTARGDYVR